MIEVPAVGEAASKALSGDAMRLAADTCNPHRSRAWLTLEPMPPIADLDGRMGFAGQQGPAAAKDGMGSAAGDVPNDDMAIHRRGA